MLRYVLIEASERRGFTQVWCGGKMKKNLDKLFANLCCSECGSDFTEESFNIMREEDDFSVLQIVCNNCGKSFGLAFLGENNIGVKGASDKDLALNLQEGPDPITSDDVIDAHLFIKNLDETWQKHLPKNYRDQNK